MSEKKKKIVEGVLEKSFGSHIKNENNDLSDISIKEAGKYHNTCKENDLSSSSVDSLIQELEKEFED